jgi:hypothetical protein
MPVDVLAREIQQEVQQDVDAGGILETCEAAVKKKALLQIRCYELWVKDGRKPAVAVNANTYLNKAEQEETYETTKNMSYRIDGTINTKEALGFLKDWSTSLVQLDSAALAALGLFVGFSDFARSPILGIGDLHHFAKLFAIVEVIFIGLSALSFFISLAAGLFLLNALPGAVQRVPADLNAMRNDVFSIANIAPQALADQKWWIPGLVYSHVIQPRTINGLSRVFRVGFLCGAGFFAASIGCGLWRVALTSHSCLLD